MRYDIAVTEALKANLGTPLKTKDPGWSSADSMLFPKGMLLREVGPITFTLQPQPAGKDGLILTAIHCGLDNAGEPHDLAHIARMVDGKNHAEECLHPMAVELLTRAIFHMLDPGPDVTPKAAP